MSAIKGQIVAASWENGHRKVECDLEDCLRLTHTPQGIHHCQCDCQKAKK